MRASEFITEAAGLGTQLYAPHPNTVNESLGLKPQVKVWTSTAIKTPEGITSEWVRWCDAEMPEWIGDTGFLFDVAPAAKILSIRSDRDAVAVAQQYGTQFKNPIELMTKMPWAAIGQDYDAVHYTAENNWQDTIMRAWDVESTAWFNPGMLGNKRAVQLARNSDYLEEMAYDYEPLYHATLRAFEPSIIKSGLLPGGNLRMFDWSDKNYVYLSNYPDIASSFVDPGVIEPDAEHEKQILELMNQGGVIFKIDQNKLNQRMLRADPHFQRDDDTGEETYIYSGVIPPSAIIGKEYFNI